MLGAIIGDVIGSRFEWNNHRDKAFELWADDCFATDDSIMTLAVAKAIIESKDNWDVLSSNTVTYMQEVGRHYPDCGYGGSFWKWMFSDNPQPYHSFGNGAAMRVSAAGLVARTLDEAKLISQLVTEVTHNHPEGIKGAEATAVAVFLAKNGSSLSEIQAYINENYYLIEFTLDDIRDTYQFNETCQHTVPQALQAFFESNSFEDAIRNAISIGGDSDTIAAICGGVAGAYYGIPIEMKNKVFAFLDDRLLGLVMEFETQYPSKLEML